MPTRGSVVPAAVSALGCRGFQPVLKVSSIPLAHRAVKQPAGSSRSGCQRLGANFSKGGGVSCGARYRIVNEMIFVWLKSAGIWPSIVLSERTSSDQEGKIRCAFASIEEVGFVEK
mmetsp:Transcript_63825/g.171000  ORF Transcript_63825/g.171000 Transcript_63825/m.171000 type:complete len:116 (-) Transcript_63825:844-1191(-)